MAGDSIRETVDVPGLGLVDVEYRELRLHQGNVLAKVSVLQGTTADGVELTSEQKTAVGEYLLARRRPQ